MNRFLLHSLTAILLLVVSSSGRAMTGDRRTARFATGSDSIPVSAISYHVIRCAGQTYGYDIIVNGKLLIHQTSMPCLAGNKGFISERDASVVAALVARKVSHGIMPPLLTIEEMKKLGLQTVLRQH